MTTAAGDARTFDSGANRVAAGRDGWRPRLVELAAVGGITPLLFPLAWLARQLLGTYTAELAIGFLCFHAAYVVNDPHFAATYLLFYRDVKRRALGDVWGRAQRVRYVLAGFVVPVVLVVWAGGALAVRSAPALGWLIQVMFLLVGWHYVKQGFGVLIALSARRGIRLGAWERRAFLGHALAAWAYAWASPADPGTLMEEHGVVHLTWARGESLARVSFVLFIVSALALAGVLLARLRERRPLPPFAALVGYLSALWIWTVYSHAEPLVMYVIPALHSLQYLYFVRLLQQGRDSKTEPRPFASNRAGARLLLFALTAIGLAWLMFHGLPEVLDAALFVPRGRPAVLGALGPAPVVAAAFVCVSIHHYFMDSVIWRRDNPDVQALGRPEGG